MTIVTCPACQARLAAPAAAAHRPVLSRRCEVAVPRPAPPDRGNAPGPMTRLSLLASGRPVGRPVRQRGASAETALARGFRVFVWLVCGVGQAALVWAFWHTRQQALPADREAALAAASCFHSLALVVAAGAIDAAVRLSLPRR